MILYCDTSALVKFYFQEEYTEVLLEHRQKSDAVAISVVGYPEFLSAVNRKKREGELDMRAFQRVIKLFNDDWPSLVKIEVTDEVNDITAHLLGKYSLRGFDAIHLAAAVLLKKRLTKDEVCFASFDDRQRDAAGKEKFAVVPSLNYS